MVTSGEGKNMSDDKYIYSFNEGSKNMRELLGLKGANLAEMTRIGLPVPFGFTLTTPFANRYFEEGALSLEIMEEIREKLRDLERVAGRKLGDSTDPLLISVRPGSPVAMKGIMPTILNLGLNDDTVKALACMTGSERFAYDNYRRLIQMYGEAALGIPKIRFRDVAQARMKEAGVSAVTELDATGMKRLTTDFQALVLKETGREFPQDPGEQLMGAVIAILRTWYAEPQKEWRRKRRMAEDLGLAVNVQQMVFGNLGSDSGVGIAYTRSPLTGAKKLTGKFLPDAQGEDLTGGVTEDDVLTNLREAYPQIYQTLEHICEILEKHYLDMQEVKFTVQHSRLYIMQTRSVRRTAQAAVKIAVDMVREGLIDQKEAVLRIEPDVVERLMHARFSKDALRGLKPLAKGSGASSGAASGEICFGLQGMLERKKAGIPAILVTEEPTAEELAGILGLEGLVLTRAGQRSHAAVLAQRVGKSCVFNFPDASIDRETRTVWLGKKRLSEGDVISIDGANGNIYVGKIPLESTELQGDFETIMEWADGFRTMRVRTNVDTPDAARQAVRFGAEGIGLCRSEHMFFGEKRIPAFRRMILADKEDTRRDALRALLPFQVHDFEDMFRVMEERPVAIRLFDPPFQDFLPKTEQQMLEYAELTGISEEKLRMRSAELKELNPILGKRGLRLAIQYPEIAEMQTKAIVLAGIHVSKELGYDVQPEILIPLTASKSEFRYVAGIVRKTAEQVMKEEGQTLPYQVGTMIEVPRAALTAGDIAEDAEFFSFGTNDLTQMTYGFSLNDTADLIKAYMELGILAEDPFKSLDQDGVGRLMKLAVDEGKKTRPLLKTGVCGEHGGDPASVEFCHRIGLQYVSCAPNRVPIARLAAAHAAIREERENLAN